MTAANVQDLLDDSSVAGIQDSDSQAITIPDVIEEEQQPPLLWFKQ